MVWKRSRGLKEINQGKTDFPNPKKLKKSKPPSRNIAGPPNIAINTMNIITTIMPPIIFILFPGDPPQY